MFATLLVCGTELEPTSSLRAAHPGDGIELESAAQDGSEEFVRSVAAAGPEDVLGHIISTFTLRDGRGVNWSLPKADEQPIVVVAFLGTQCPLARLYAPRLSRLADQYRDRGVAVVGIDSNQQDSATALIEFAREYGLAFPLLKDPANVLADQFGALRTPEVFLLDARRAIRYRGRIDDQYGFARDDVSSPPRAFQRPQPTRHDLIEAIDDLLAERTIRVQYTEAPGCLIGRTREPDPSSPVTWSREVAHILQQRCQTCHRPGQLAPFSLLTYDEAVGWSEMMAEVVREGRMPPWHANPEYGDFANDSRLTSDEQEAIVAWARHGAPLGDPADAPPPRQFTDGWQIEPPDLVIPMSKMPFRVPAEGVVEYQWFYVDPQLEHDIWVRAAEARAGAPAVVHHVTVYFKPPNVPWDLRLNEEINLLVGFNPGGGPWEMPPGTALKIPAGAQIAFEMHYTPIGVEQEDLSYIGLVLADPDEVEQQALCIMPANTTFEIPPLAENHRVEASYVFDKNVDVLAMRPHMHLRGKSFRYTAHYPDGTAEILLDVPRFEFDWQYSYFLKSPRRLPRGTRLECVAHFDNSPQNRSNPDPHATVRWGDQTWEEMMIGIIAVSLPDHDPHVAPIVAVRRVPRLFVLSGLAAALAVVALLIARRLAPSRAIE